MTPQEILEQFGPRESMEYDVVIVGAGPSGLSAAIKLKQLAEKAGKEPFDFVPPDNSALKKKIADLGPNSSARQKELRAAGVQHGRFVLFKESLPRPPFDPPVNVICQALQFDSPEHARAFVRALQPDDSLATTAMTWIPEANRDFATVNAAESPAPRGEEWARFVIRAGEAEQTMNAVYDATSSGSTVFTIVTGEADSTQSQEQRDRLSGVLAARSARLASADR